MSWLSRFLNVFRRDRLQREFEDEMQFHLSSRIDEFTSRGMSVEEAREQAGRQFGNSLVLFESSRDIKLFPRIESIFKDVVFGLRQCRRNLTVTTVAVLSLALAIGSSTAAFSLIDALILRSLPVKDPEQLVYVAYRAPDRAHDALSFNYLLFESMRDASRRQVELFAMSDQSRQDAIFDDAGGQSEKVYGQWISGDAFAMLGVKTIVGRPLLASDDLKAGQHPAAVISYDFWSRRFGRNASVLGRWVTIRDKQLQIVGVAEKGFTGVEPGIMTDLWAPNMMWDELALTDSGTRWLRVWGRMRSGVSRDQALAVLQTVFTNFRREQASTRGQETPEQRERLIATRVYLRPAANGPSNLRQEYERALWVLASVAGLVLLLASANVASLLVARAAQREREMALRISIGAGRGRLIQQVLIESSLLSIASCALGGLIAVLATSPIVSLISTSHSAVRLDLHLDWRVVAFLAATGSLVTFLFGLPPALRASTVSPNEAIKSGSGKHTAKVRAFGPLVAAQTATCFVVLFVAGICLSSFAKLARTDLGIDPKNLAVIYVEAKELYKDQKRQVIWEHVLERLNHTPGIQSASMSGWGLFQGRGRNKGVQIPGRPTDSYSPWYLPVSPGFFKTMGIRLVGGRDFDRRDARQDAPPAVVVNESFARRYFPEGSALGRSFFRVDAGATLVPQQIIGIVRDAKYTSVRDEAPTTVYDPLRPEDSAAIEVRTNLEAGALTALLRNELPRIHPAFRMTDITLQSTLIENTLMRDRALALLSAFFSTVAIVLVIVGLYGVLSHGVTQRTREIGIRLALGARPLRVVGLVVSQIGLVTLIGLVIGIAGALAGSKFFTALLYEVKPADVRNLVAPLTGLIVAAAIAGLVPVLRAMRVSPTTALRYE